MKLPSEFVARMSDLLPDFKDFLASYADTPCVGLRANRLKITPDKLRKLLPDITGSVDWCADGFYYHAGFRPGKSPYYHAGLYYIQEPSAMSPAAVMDVEPGQRVLDLCAAPGGKSTQLAAKLSGKGILFANDISASRARALLKNIELSGAINCVITNESPERLAMRFTEYFDRILIDAPCSGEGMFRRDPDAQKAWTERKPEACAILQRESLHFAAMMLKPGGRLMYSTCTFAPEENELMIDEFLTTHTDFVGVLIPHAKHGLEPGLRGEGYTARIWPHRQKGEGHFMAYLEKQGRDVEHSSIVQNGSVAQNSSVVQNMGIAQSRGVARNAPALHSRGAWALYTDFCDKYLKFSPEPTFRHGNSLYIAPPGLPDLSGLRVLRAGLYLGDILTKRFEPSQAFAMTLRPDEVKSYINFALADNDLYRYLKGESFELASRVHAYPWNLIFLDVFPDIFPLGWAKITDGRIKNKYSKGWLMS